MAFDTGGAAQGAAQGAAVAGPWGAFAGGVLGGIGGGLGGGSKGPKPPSYSLSAKLTQFGNIVSGSGINRASSTADQRASLGDPAAQYDQAQNASKDWTPVILTAAAAAAVLFVIRRR